MYSIIFLSVISFCACLVLTPVVRRWSERNGLFDRPNPGRKRHPPGAATGGIAIVLSYVAAVGVFLVSPLNATGSVNVPFAIGLAPAAIVVFTIGLLDDLIVLPAWVKLLGQVIASLLAYAGGVHVAGVGGYGAAEWATLPITVVWLVACSNAFNLIDGLDGLATGVACLRRSRRWRPRSFTATRPWRSPPHLSLARCSPSCDTTSTPRPSSSATAAASRWDSCSAASARCGARSPRRCSA
jgi:UDP-GlcNAc:undecaprenyl-phosphate GlcNAc-1-phosphate transferase